MIEIPVPNHPTLRLQHLVLDYNGTLAVDGLLIPGVAQRLTALASRLQVHVVTADTFGHAAASLTSIPCQLQILAGDTDQARAKLELVQGLGPDGTVSIGNGRNDELMLKRSALGIAVILGEGAWVNTVMTADVICTSILDALDLLHSPLRLVATLRR